MITVLIYLRGAGCVSASLIIHPPAVFMSRWWSACPAAVSTAGVPVSSQSCSSPTEHIPAFTSSPNLTINQPKCCLPSLCFASCWGCSAMPSALCSCPPLHKGHGEPLPKLHSGFSSRAMFTRALQAYLCLTKITLKLQFDLFILYPFKNMAIVLLSRGGGSALCQWTVCNKQVLCGGSKCFVSSVREVLFLFANTLVWVRPERHDADCVCERTWTSQIPASTGKNSAIFGQPLKFGRLCWMRHWIFHLVWVAVVKDCSSQLFGYWSYYLRSFLLVHWEYFVVHIVLLGYEVAIPSA